MSRCANPSRTGLVLLVIAAPRQGLADEPLEVEVRGQRNPLPPKDPSVAGSVIGAERLAAPGLKASDVLRTQPGVAVLETGGYGALSTASIRGATGAQTPVYLAGVRLNDDVGGIADLSQVPLWLAHRIEIYRSNAPLAGDQLGIGGAIFIEPRRPRAPEVGAGWMAGSFGAHALWARAGVGDDDSAVLVGVRSEGASNDYRLTTDGGTRFDPRNERGVVLTNADARTRDVWATASARLGSEGRADFVFNDARKEQGLPVLTLFPSVRARATFERDLVAVAARTPCADGACEITTTTSALWTKSAFDDPLRELALGTPRLEFDASRVDDGIATRWWVSDDLSIAPSVRASIEYLGVTAENVGRARARRVFLRAAGQAEWRALPAVVLRGVASAECHGTSLEGRLPTALFGDVEGPAGDALCQDFQPAGRAGVQLGGDALVFLVNVGRYARVPTLAELYGISGAVRGNTAVRPEAGVTLEVGLRASTSASAFGAVSFDVFAFAREVRDLIAYQRSAIGYVRPFNVGSARVAGIELLTQYIPATFITFELAATLLDPRSTSADHPANDVLPYQSKMVLVPRVEGHSKLRAYPFESVKAAVSYFFESSRYADPAGLVLIPEQSSLDVDAELSSFDGHLSLRGRVANVLDRPRSDLVGYPLPGRAAYVAMEARW